MKPLITLLLLASVAFGATTASKKQEWRPDGAYSCKLEGDKSKDVYKLTLIGYRMAVIGDKVFHHVETEYDIYQTQSDQGLVTLGLKVDQKTAVLSFDDGSSVRLTCTELK